MKIRVASALLSSEPDALTLGSHRLWGLHICENNVTIEATMIIHPLGWSVEASASTKNTLDLLALSFLPHIHLGLIDLSVEGHNGKLNMLSESVEF